MIHDRDTALAAVASTIDGLGIRDIPTAPRSPWQNGFAERVIGSIRRECLDHLIVFNEKGLRQVLAQYVTYYHGSRTHLGLGEYADGQAGRRTRTNRRDPATRRPSSPLRAPGGLTQ